MGRQIRNSRRGRRAGSRKGIRKGKKTYKRRTNSRSQIRGGMNKKQQLAHLKKLINDNTIYDKLIQNKGIVLEWGNVVEFRVRNKERTVLLLDDVERKKLIFDIASLAQLTNLTEINLSKCNNVTGNIKDLAPLKKLTKIDLRSTGVSGDIAELASLLKLTYINLNQTSVSGSIERLAPLKNLTYINLSPNPPPFFEHSHSPAQLRVRGAVIGNIEHLASLTKLTEINLSFTGVDGNIEDLRSLTNLTEINLGYTNVEGNIEHLNSLMNLAEIHLSGCKGIMGDIAHLGDLGEKKYYQNLQKKHDQETTFNLRSNSLSPNLTTINLNDTNVSGDIKNLGGGEESFSDAPLNLPARRLQLMVYNPKSRKRHHGLLYLTNLYLNNTQVTGDIKHLIGQLEVAKLENTKVTGDITKLASMSKLGSIDLQQTDVTGDFNKLFTPNITTLKLSGTGVENVPP